jgi:hypothetical protein
LHLYLRELGHCVGLVMALIREKICRVSGCRRELGVFFRRKNPVNLWGEKPYGKRVVQHVMIKTYLWGLPSAEANKQSTWQHGRKTGSKTPTFWLTTSPGLLSFFQATMGWWFSFSSLSHLTVSTFSFTLHMVFIALRPT